MKHSEPVEVVAVAVTKLDAGGELYLDWLLEGGICELDQPGVLLLVADRKITDSNNGHGEVYVAPPAQYAGELSLAACDVLAERRRQIEKKGWTPEHDDLHDDWSLAAAAAVYATCANGDYYNLNYSGTPIWPARWNFKGGTYRQNLVKAGALIQAEIERLDRAAAVAQEQKP